MVDGILTTVLQGSKLSTSVVLQKSNLRKPSLQRVMAAEDLPSSSVSSNETKLSALVIAHAILNPFKVQCLSPEKDVTQWDIDMFAETRPHAAEKTKYFQYPQWGHISDPVTVLDAHGRVMLWYLPGIIPPERVVKQSLPPWSSGIPLLMVCCRLQSLMVSKRLQDKVYESSNLKIPAVKEWLHEISYAEGLVLPHLARVGKDAIAAKGDWVVTQPPSGIQWPSIYVGIDVIVNQETPPHVDKVFSPSLLDLLPGTMIYLAGKLLHHSAPKWEKVLQKSLGRGSLYTFQPTKTRRGKLTHEEVDARHLYYPSGSQPSTPGTPRTKASSQQFIFSDFHDPLDILDSDWNDVDDAPQSRRHTKGQNDYIREWLPWRAGYLSIILEGEHRIGNGLVLGMMLRKIQEMEDLPSSALPAPSQVLIYLQTGKFSITDGDFTAQHMKMNRPELDVTLSDGKGYMVSEGPYQNHLQQSLDSKERSTCSNHRAINACKHQQVQPQVHMGLVPQLVLDMAALSPTLWWNFQKGERYMNTDYSICNALGYGSERITKALVIYDVGCQWSVNFWSRLWRLSHAVGKFHLAAHKLSCFPRYSLNFVKGAGHLDGEILETLWAPFNKISPTARSMTQAHRQEVYDDHMRDSNWKKLVGLVPSLLKKYKTSNKCLEEMNQAYEQLTAVLDPDKVSGWELDALRAEADRGEALDIYLLKGDKAPTFHEVQLQLMKNPMTPFGSGGSVAWLAEGISIEDSQILWERRRRGGEEDREFWGEDDGYWEVPGEEVEELASELMSIWMPSSIGSDKLTELGLVDLLKEERELRIGQANDCLDQLRTDLGNKAMEGTRTKKEIQKVVARINKHVRGYQRARQAILRLDPNGDMAEKYQEILPDDLAVSKEVTEENRFGQGTSKLAWFWMMEGEQSQLSLQGGGLMEEFYRINWLKARARRDRWKEEVSLVRHEMLWTCLWFEYHKDMWEKRALESTEPGKEAYAKKQMGLWNDFAKKARLMFQGMYKEARGNLELRNEILAEVKGKILEHEPIAFCGTPPKSESGETLVHHAGQQDEIAIIQQILTLAFTGKSKEDAGEGENAREEKARPTKAGDYKKAFTAFTAAQWERRDTKDPKTIGQRTRIVQQWWESLSDDRKAEAGRAAEKWNKLGHESGEGQIKLAVEHIDYLLTEPGEDDSAEKQEAEISLNEDGNPEVPTWGGQKLKVQQNLARAVFQAAYDECCLACA
ncbi:hypothetical protein EV401DRAFT_1884110 [Pisolithus croceorrhizus]|nr:hypothetical protein EV401DRAFT_1884110 [Pisolithus croceorrhizus]